MPQKELPFFEQEEQDALGVLLLQRATADQARRGWGARLMRFWLGHGMRVEFVALIMILPADEKGVIIHRSAHRSLMEALKKHYAKQPDDSTHGGRP